LLNAISPDGWFGKTSPASYPAPPTTYQIRVRRLSTWTVQADPKTGKRFWLRTNTTVTKHMLSGASSPDFQNSGMGGPTASWTLNTPEHMAFPERSPSDGAVCSLSDILETGDVPRRFFLTAKACAGILRRAEKRGKDLPEALRLALQSVAGRAEEPPNSPET
jgi:hypothetical protein